MKKTLLEQIDSPSDLRQLNEELLPVLAQELRDFIINIISVKEGHLGASLGVIELTVALHYVFNTPKDLLIWDVGHQAYGHKILTGRRAVFSSNRQFGGISGFPKISESEYDAFGTGHSSTSISAALGMALASNLRGETEKHHIAVIGDASIVSGMAFEALNHAGTTDANLLVILNDNSIGIDSSVGALKEYLFTLKNDSNQKNKFAEILKFNYSVPIDGHDIFGLIKELRRLQKIKGPKLLHLITTKGKGLEQAEKNQVKYHAPGKFDAITGNLAPQSEENLPPRYQDVFGLTLLDLAKKNKKIIGVTPAMPTGSSLKLMMDEFPMRTFDVGIAEQHAVTFSAGMATQGMIVFCTIYSTFIQRAYDQIIHDVALQNIPVIFCIDRAGLVGQDGATHHGVFDLAFLRCIPNLIICSPMNEIDFQNILYTSQLKLENPIAIRYPRGRGEIVNWKKDYFGKYKKVEIGKALCLKTGTKIAVLSHGTIGNEVSKVLEKAENSLEIALYDFSFAKPLDNKLLHIIFAKFNNIITIEETTKNGGFGSSILEFSAFYGYTSAIEIIGIPDVFIEHGTVEELRKKAKINHEYLETILRKI